MTTRLINGVNSSLYLATTNITKKTVFKPGTNLLFSHLAIPDGSSGTVFSECILSMPKKAGAVLTLNEECYIDLVTQEITDDNTDDVAGTYLGTDPQHYQNAVFLMKPINSTPGLEGAIELES